MRRTTFSEAREPEENLPPQRRQVLAGLKEETWPLLKNDSRTNASADTKGQSTRLLTEGATSPLKAAVTPNPEQTPSQQPQPSVAPAPNSGAPTTSKTAPDTSPTPDTAATAKSITESDGELPESLESATMAEILLYRLGINRDRDRVLKAEAKRAKPFELQQPLTPEKVAQAIAQVSMALLNHELSPLEANTILFALQTMLTAVRMGILADTIKQRRSTNTTEEKQPCTTQESSRSQRSKASASGRNSGLRSESPATTTSSSRKSRSGSSARGKSSQKNSPRKK